MAKFRILSHGRLQEWVAEEKGYFNDEGLDYEFIVRPIITWAAEVETVDSTPADIQRGAFESYEDGRGCNLSAACLQSLLAKFQRRVFSALSSMSRSR